MGEKHEARGLDRAHPIDDLFPTEPIGKEAKPVFRGYAEGVLAAGR